MAFLRCLRSCWLLRGYRVFRRSCFLFVLRDGGTLTEFSQDVVQSSLFGMSQFSSSPPTVAETSWTSCWISMLFSISFWKKDSCSSSISSGSVASVSTESVSKFSTSSSVSSSSSSDSGSMIQSSTTPRLSYVVGSADLLKLISGF